MIKEAAVVFMIGMTFFSFGDTTKKDWTDEIQEAALNQEAMREVYKTIPHSEKPGFVKMILKAISTMPRDLAFRNERFIDVSVEAVRLRDDESYSRFDRDVIHTKENVLNVIYSSLAVPIPSLTNVTKALRTEIRQDRIRMSRSTYEWFRDNTLDKIEKTTRGMNAFEERNDLAMSLFEWFTSLDELEMVLKTKELQEFPSTGIERVPRPTYREPTGYQNQETSVFPPDRRRKRKKRSR